MQAAKIGVSSGNGIGQRNKPASGQLDQNRFTFRIAESGLAQQFPFCDDGIVNGESGGIEQNVKPACVEIVDEDVGVYEDRDFFHASISARNASSDCFRLCFRSAAT